jgi:hypothetical protein
MWCLEVIKHMNKPKPKQQDKKDESETKPREDQARPS